MGRRLALSSSRVSCSPAVFLPRSICQELPALGRHRLLIKASLSDSSAMAADVMGFWQSPPRQRLNDESRAACRLQTLSVTVNPEIRGLVRATTFIRRPSLSGPFGALMDEYARAAEDFCRVVEG